MKIECFFVFSACKYDLEKTTTRTYILLIIISQLI